MPAAQKYRQKIMKIERIRQHQCRRQRRKRKRRLLEMFPEVRDRRKWHRRDRQSSRTARGVRREPSVRNDMREMTVRSVGSAR